MLPVIRRNYAHNFDGVHPQGVTRDSLESFGSSTAVQGGQRPALRAFLSAQRQQLNYLYCTYILYIIYFSV